MKAKLRVVGINFDHFHMGDLLRNAAEHPRVEIVGICDEQPSRMVEARRNFGVPDEHVFTRVDQCLESTLPDFAILCPSTAGRAELVERVAAHGVHILIEKPFAASVAEADRMTAAAKRHKVMLAINWPLRWVAGHSMAQDLVADGVIGDLLNVYYYGGNRGPLWHGADKIEQTPTAEQKRESWFYKRSKGGGSLLDYLGYGTTLGTWYHQGRRPVEVTAIVDRPKGLEVDEQSITVARYASGLSRFETRWGTFTDPWTHQPQPECGFVLTGTEGTISSYDYEPVIRLQTRRRPAVFERRAASLKAPFQNPVQYFVHCLRTDRPPEGPLSPKISRIGQQIVDSAMLSAKLKQTVKLVK